MKTFEAGKSYFGRSIGDSDMIITVNVASRTAKTIVTDEGKRFRIGVWNDESTEYVRPWGTYSMAPFVTAEREVVA